MKRGLVFKSVILMFLCFFALSSIISQQVYATTTGTQMYSGVDYSGQGTIISKNQRSGQARISDSYVSVPVYLGKYENQEFLVNDWIWKGWSDWSTTNNRSTGSVFSYRGTDTITEYNTESKKQYVYQRWNSQLYPVYTTFYITKYQGNQWWNFLSFITVEKTTGYGGAIADHNITERYTESRITSYRGGYEYTGWEDGKPFTWPWEIAWEDTPKTTRTVYRYQSRNITWNSNTRDGNEYVPLKYSLESKQGEALGYGIKWALNHNMSGDSNQDVTLVQYHISATDVKK